MTAAGQVICIEEIGTVSIPLANGNTIELQNVALALDYDSNLISLEQLQENRITYHNDPSAITLMRNGEIIALARRERNLFMLDLIRPGRAMATISQKAMATTGRGWPTNLVSQNKQICLWHQRLAHVSNARIVRTAKLVDGINLNIEDKRYDPVKVTIDSDDSDISDLDANSDPHINNLPNTQPVLEMAHATKANEDNNLVDKLYIPCVGSKLTQVVRRNKSMTPISSKLEEIYVDLWGPHNPPSQSGSTYLTIFMCEHTQKIWTLYFRRKDDFVNAFQA